MSTALFSLENRTALVTGGNGGIGRAIALGFRKAGARVAVTGRNETKNKAIANELGDPQSVFSLDVREEEAVASTIAQVKALYGHLDILVNNAGLFKGGSLLEMEQSDWDVVIGTHLTGSFLCAKHASRVMVEQKSGGKIINIGSMYSLYGAPDFVDYSSAKAGLLGLTRSLAIELAPYNIQVNAILPGWFETELTAGMPSSKIGEQIRRKTPAGRWGELDELVGTAIYLASSASNFVTGTQIPVDGGYAISERFADSMD